MSALKKPFLADEDWVATNTPGRGASVTDGLDIEPHCVSCAGGMVIGPDDQPSKLGDNNFGHQSSTFWSATLNMQKIILGAGIMVIPKSFLMVGTILGVLFLGIVGGVTWFTISGLLLAAERTGATTYASVVGQCCGRHARWVLLVAIALNCFGLCVIFAVIFADILIGTGNYLGVLNELLPMVPLSAWFLSRWFVLLVLFLVLLGPLVMVGDLARLRWMNLIGVASVMTFAVSAAWLAGAAICQGAAHRPTLLPDWDTLGDSPFAIAASVAAVVSVLLNCNVCHQGVFPATTLLKPYTRGSMNWVIGIALLSCNALYVLVAVCTCIAFGPGLDADVLNNMNAADMAPLLGRLPALVVAYTVQVGYFISLLGSFVLSLYPLRSAVLEVLLGQAFCPFAQHLHALFYPVTVMLLGAIYATAIFVPSIWLVLSLVGSVAATIMGFIFPGIIMLITHQAPTVKDVSYKAVAVLVVLLGAFLLVNGFLAVVT